MRSSSACTTTLPTRSARSTSPVAFRAIQLMTPRPMRVAPTSRERTFAAAGVERPNPASIDSGDTNSARPNTTAATPPIMRARRGLTARRVRRSFPAVPTGVEPASEQVAGPPSSGPFPEPQACVGGGHGLLYRAEQVIAQRIKVDFVAKTVGKHVESAGGVVARAVETP